MFIASIQPSDRLVRPSGIEPLVSIVPQPAPPPPDLPIKTIKPEFKITSPPTTNNTIRYDDIFLITAYDLSIASCGKTITSRGYGETRSGFSLKNHTRTSAMTIATDTRIIRLGSIVLIKFIDKKFSRFDGIYTSRDTGGAVKGKIIDIFMGDFHSSKDSKIVNDFGVQKAYIKYLSR